MGNYPFDFFELPTQRSTKKPRENGLTMLIDWGLGLARVRDALELASAYVDFGKIAVGTSRLYDEGLLRAKIELYKAFDVRPFLGGMFQEQFLAAQGLQALDSFYEEAKRVGFEIIEVSDNLNPISEAERQRQIELAQAHGLGVLGEVGSKFEATDAATLVGQARTCLEAGCELVLVEGAELVEAGEPKRELLDAVAGGLDMARVMFELPGPWISGCTLADIHDLKKFFIREFGPEVNIANVMLDECLETEALRCGLSVMRP